MSERKIINKYFPPDFDPEKLISRKRLMRQQGYPETKVMNVRMMYPFTVCCIVCKEFTYVGTKFNSKVEKVIGEDYLGIVIWRFYGRCPNCRNDFIFKTDPKNCDYIMESGGTRTYDANRDKERAAEHLKQQHESDIAGDAMRQLEAKTYDTANEINALQQLEELRKMNKVQIDNQSLNDCLTDHVNKKKRGVMKNTGYKPSNSSNQDVEKDVSKLVDNNSSVVSTCVSPSQDDGYSEDDRAEVERFNKERSHLDKRSLYLTETDDLTDTCNLLNCDNQNEVFADEHFPGNDEDPLLGSYFSEAENGTVTEETIDTLANGTEKKVDEKTSIILKNSRILSDQLHRQIRVVKKSATKHSVHDQTRNIVGDASLTPVSTTTAAVRPLDSKNLVQCGYASDLSSETNDSPLQVD